MELFWTEQRITRLTFLVSEGWSYSQMGSDIGVTRGAISGKIDRLGLSRPARSPEDLERARLATAARNLENRRTARGTKTIQPPRERKMLNAPAATQQFEGRLNIPFRDLRDYSNKGANQCRFIADEPPGPDYLACGNETPAGESYCGHCKRLTIASHTNTQAQRAQIIRLGTRQYLASLRRVA